MIIRIKPKFTMVVCNLSKGIISTLHTMKDTADPIAQCSTPAAMCCHRVYVDALSNHEKE